MLMPMSSKDTDYLNLILEMEKHCGTMKKQCVMKILVERFKLFGLIKRKNHNESG